MHTTLFTLGCLLRIMQADPPVYKVIHRYLQKLSYSMSHEEINPDILYDFEKIQKEEMSGIIFMVPIFPCMDNNVASDFQNYRLTSIRMLKYTPSVPPETATISILGVQL